MSQTENPARSGPLAGVRVVELAGIGPCPFAGMILADLGADVLRVERSSAVPASLEGTVPNDVLQRHKRSIGVDLKSADGVAVVLELVERADCLIEGFRPGVTERLGLGPEVCLSRNGRLVYGRMTGWGQDGPLADHAGHDIDYIAIAGVLGAIGRKGEAPLPPLNLVGDFGGGGMLLALGVVSALVSAGRDGRGQVVDAAMVDGAALLMSMMWGFRAMGFWEERRGVNMLDTGAPFYDTYECADGEFVAVGAIEPQFFQALCRVLEVSPEELPPQMNRAEWPAVRRRFAELFRQRPRDEWVERAKNERGDACLAPVLSMTEATAHPHNEARGTFVTVGGITQPNAAPRFSGTPASVTAAPCRPGEYGRAALADWGLAGAAVEDALSLGVLKAF